MDSKIIRQSLLGAARLWCVIFLALGLASDGNAGSAEPTPVTDAEVAAFWETVFSGPSPYGVPPLNGQRANGREAAGAMLWDVQFDSYQDPDTGRPARLGGVLAVPRDMPSPSGDGRFPGLVVTHSVGVRDPMPDNVVALATYFAARGYTTLAFFVRGYGTSRLAKLNHDSPLGRCAGYFCANLPGADERPLDSVWPGFAVDAIQAGEFLAAQPEVLDPEALSFIGHSLGGYIALKGAIFSDRFKVLVASAPAATTPDPEAWMDYWNTAPWVTWAEEQSDPEDARARLTRLWHFVGAYRSINNPQLVAKNPDWKLQNTAAFLYGGERDPAVPASDVEAAYRLADGSNDMAFYRSPTGAHGGAETWDRGQAWLAGHYPGRTLDPPLAALRVVGRSDRSVQFSAEESRGAGALVSWIYDFGDGTTRFWGDAVAHTYAQPGEYTATVTVIDGAGQRSTASVNLRVD